MEPFTPWACNVAAGPHYGQPRGRPASRQATPPLRVGMATSSFSAQLYHQHGLIRRAQKNSATRYGPYPPLGRPNCVEGRYGTVRYGRWYRAPAQRARIAFHDAFPVHWTGKDRALWPTRAARGLCCHPRVLAISASQRGATASISAARCPRLQLLTIS
eukprot:363674-Chlamydomonas_euryale.AAC.1